MIIGGDTVQIGDRIKLLRKNLNLTQVEFAERIGLKQAAIGLLENATRNVTDRNILSICENFGADEEWLRTGHGNMYRTLNADNDLAIEIAKLLSTDDDWTKNTVLQFLKLPKEQREVIKTFLLAITPIKKTPE